MSGGSGRKCQPASGRPPQGFIAISAAAYSCFSYPAKLMPVASAQAALLSGARRLVGYDLVTAVTCSAAGLAAFLLLHTAFRLVRRFFHTGSSNIKTPGHPVRNRDEMAEFFVQEADHLHVSARVAAETFKVLSACLPHHTAFSPNDDLRSRLGIAEDQITAILYSLPQTCCRLPHAFDVAAIISVYDLLSHIEAAPALRSARSMQRRACDATGALAEAAPSPLAGLQNASPRDSRFRTRPHFSGQMRRASDYSGPYRRATDKPADAAYTGPLRRKSDPSASRRPVDGAASTPPETKSLEKQYKGPQRGTEAAAGPLGACPEPVLLKGTASAAPLLLPLQSGFSR